MLVALDEGALPPLIPRGFELVSIAALEASG